MVRNVFIRMTRVHSDALAIWGWLAFVSGAFVDEAWLKLILWSVARVLP